MNLEKELGICRKHKGKGYCYWGVCKFCGVPNMLKKLKTGEIEHDEKRHKKFREFMEEGNEGEDRA